MPYQSIGMDRVLEAVSTPPGTGAVTIGTAVPGFRTFASVMAQNDTCAYFIEAVDAKGNLTGAWERGYGTATGSPVTTFARSLVIDSSNAGALVNFTTAVRIGCAPMTDSSLIYTHPGGRLAIGNTVPVCDGSTTTNLYYLAYLHDRVPLWNGAGIQVVKCPSAVQVSITGVAANTAYDVFGYLSGGTMALDPPFAWSTAIARVTPLTFTNGFWCKGGDPTRLYLGSFYASAAGTIYDSANVGGATGSGKRLLWNMYNRVARNCYYFETTASWTYASGTYRIINGRTAPVGTLELFRGFDEDAVIVGSFLGGGVPNNLYFFAAIAIGGSITSGGAGDVSNTAGNTMNAGVSLHYAGLPGVGYRQISLQESCGGGTVTLGNNYGSPGLNAIVVS